MNLVVRVVIVMSELKVFFFIVLLRMDGFMKSMYVIVRKVVILVKILVFILVLYFLNLKYFLNYFMSVIFV